MTKGSYMRPPSEVVPHWLAAQLRDEIVRPEYLCSAARLRIRPRVMTAGCYSIGLFRLSARTRDDWVRALITAL